MQEQLLVLGLGAENEVWLVGNPDLAQDLAGLLAFRLESIRLGWLRGRYEKHGKTGRGLYSLTRKAVVAKTEQTSARQQRLGRDIVNRFHRWLVDMA